MRLLLRQSGLVFFLLTCHLEYEIGSCEICSTGELNSLQIAEGQRSVSLESVRSKSNSSVYIFEAMGEANFLVRKSPRLSCEIGLLDSGADCWGWLL